MTAKHTPKPWTLSQYGAQVRRINFRTNETLFIADCRPPVHLQGFESPTSLKEQLANAALISAAPELLEELEDSLMTLLYLLPSFNSEEEAKHWNDAIERKRTVIAKARGVFK